MHCRDENFWNRFESTSLRRTVSPVLPPTDLSDLPSFNLFVGLNNHESSGE
jgi:hypothetical protein